MKKIAGLFLAAVAAMFVIAAVPTAASAATTWKYCDANGGGGTPNDGWIQINGDDDLHAKIRNCKVTWHRENTGEYWQSITFDMADAMSDDASALADASSGSDARSSCSGTGNVWCYNKDFAWKSYELLLNGRAASVDTRLGWGKSGRGITDQWTKVTALTPAGY
ncbi:hypothetical protein [Actinorhabdospora filicis]|uniref:hypothetical protein n=1 Tax=Actinorhabdospora filicis TaxID=1785913 RepID=UPI0025562FA7|nr:hypothetical protein [Actinorhabdospora filicis]